eukprot:SAG31_NODE_21088_length_558_cov_0.899782_1_plen_96_part_01
MTKMFGFQATPHQWEDQSALHWASYWGGLSVRTIGRICAARVLDTFELAAESVRLRAVVAALTGRIQHLEAVVIKFGEPLHTGDRSHGHQCATAAI